MDHIKLKRLEIKKYRNVAPGTVLHFSDGFNVLLGKNGTGKTTLLDLIAMIVASDLSPLKDTEFDFAYTFSMPGGTFDIAVESHADEREPWMANNEVPASFAKESIFRWSYKVELRSAADTYTFQFSGTEQALSLTASGPAFPEPLKRNLPALPPFVHSLREFMLFTVTYEVLNHYQKSPYGKDLSSLADEYVKAGGWFLRCSANGGRFDESLAVLGAIIGKPIDLPGSVLRPAKFEMTKRSGLMNSSFSSLLWPSELHQKLEERVSSLAKQNAPPIETIQLSDVDLPFLKRIVETMRFVSGRVTVQLTGGGPLHDKTSYGIHGFHFTASDGSIFIETALKTTLSYGQRRLLSFLYYASANPHIVIADELVNGLHHAWAQTCINEILDRQSFLASQDPLLFDFLAFASEQEVLESFVLCSLEPGDDRSQFVWKNLDPDAASAFYRAYDAGIQHVSEILRTKGLW